MVLGLYLHIPFCIKKCHYCRFVITTNRSEQSKQRFFSSLQEQIRFARNQYGPLSFETLYIGGGTPSALSVEELEWILKELRASFEFESNAEVTCEINPGDVQLDDLMRYRQLGINRISLGVQSFQEDKLKHMNRPHGTKEIFSTWETLKKANFENINLDLICRLPNQSLEDVASDLQVALNLEPAQITLYDLEIHEETVYGLWQKKDKLTLGSEQLHAQMVEKAEQQLLQAGYGQYALSCFAKPGFESRHNLLYWHNQDYLGLGPGAFSYMEGVRYQFAENVDRYLEKCQKSDWQNDSEDVLSEEEKRVENFITRIRLQEGANFRELPDFMIARLNQLCSEGFFVKEGDCVCLTQKGRYLFENVMASLLSVKSINSMS